KDLASLRADDDKGQLIDGKKPEALALTRVLSGCQLMNDYAYPLVAPAGGPEISRDHWTSLGASLTNSLRQGRIDPPAMHYARMVTAYRQGKPAAFNAAVEDYRQWLRQRFVPELTKGKREFFFNSFQPFYKALVIYVLAFLLACASWFKLSDGLRRSALYLVMLAWCIHTFGLVFRMVLEGRPPVTNLYSSAIFIGWGAAILGMVLEKIYRDGIGSAIAATAGFITLIIAHNLALGGDTMEMLRAVLDTNFWLATHVTVVTLGYSATFVAGFLATIYILRGVFSRTLSETTARGLARMVYGIICFATLFSFVGTILGGIWADQSWGRFWGWDPKENGALLIVIWNAVILHARWGGMIRERGLMNMALAGNIVTGWSWFGVNMLGIGLHSYGFTDQAFWWLLVFVFSQLLLIGLGLLPKQYWRSFRRQDSVAGRLRFEGKNLTDHEKLFPKPQAGRGG
ncbi:MAG TPA: cytochrome c biogenesis protein CcsA, partial [Verrucomicrobiae bacterium]|nr:cytochrome c biogenesis protein CcsA [Verrucomicrobiae bacterium]